MSPNFLELIHGPKLCGSPCSVRKSASLRDVVARVLLGRCQKPKVHCAKGLCPWEWPRGKAAQGRPTWAAGLFYLQHLLVQHQNEFVPPSSWARWFAILLAAMHSIVHFGCPFRWLNFQAELAFLLVSVRLVIHIYAFPRNYRWNTAKKIRMQNLVESWVLRNCFLF